MKRLKIEEMKEIKGGDCPPGSTCIGGACLRHVVEDIWQIVQSFCTD